MKRYLADRREVLFFAFLIMLITTAPYLLAYSSQGEEWRFTGFLIAVEDGNSYIAKMLSGAAGDWLFRTPYSIEHQQGVVAFFPYLVLGKLSFPPAQHEQLVALYHGFRIIAGIMAVLATYDFLDMFVKDKKLVLWAVTLASLGGGIGWILAITENKDFLGSLPLDFISPESFGFLSLIGFPHLAAGRALLLWGIRSYLLERKGWLAGSLIFLMGLFQPIFIPIAWIVVGIHASLLWAITKIKPDLMEMNGELSNQNYWLAAVQLMLVSCSLFIYTAYSFLTDPYLVEWARQNNLPSPHWLHYVFAYGLVLPLALIGIYKNSLSNPRYGLLLAGWILVFPVLISAPVSTQRRLAEGIWIVLVTGMTIFFAESKLKTWVYRLMAFALMPTSIVLFSGMIIRASNPSLPAFIPTKESEAYTALAGTAAVDSVVLSERKTGNSLPAWVPVQVVVGHGPETIHSSEWMGLIDNALVIGDAQDACDDLFLEKQINYLFWGPAESQRWKWDPAGQSCLRMIYNAGEYYVYEVIE